MRTLIPNLRYDLEDLPESFIIEELERLRREQNPERERPGLELPMPPSREAPPRPQPDKPSRVVILDI